jgi:peptide-methionine (R)-S-oxide reductase
MSINNTINSGDTMEYKVKKTDQEWKEVLTPMQFYVLREKGTERPYTGEYDHHFEKGTYVCAACNTPLFESETKFNSGCGWPAFFAPLLEDNINIQIDRSHGMVRSEVLCSHCGGHLGHVFEDGPEPTGLRYCINSAALEFIPGDENSSEENK